MSERPSATVVVPTRDRHELLAQTLPSIVAAVNASPGAEVIVVEQGAQSSRALVEQHGGRYVADDGVGVSRARNLGIRHAHGRVVLFTDDDCVVPVSWIAQHLAVLEDVTLAGSFGVVRGLARAGEGDAAALVSRRSGRSHPWDVGHSSNMAVRRSVLMDVGGFDERIGPGSGGVVAGEDADAIKRLLSYGATLATGTGDPVEHLPWRADHEVSRLLRSYESGTGVWIGAALRARRPGAASSARQRLRMLREQSAELGPLAQVGHVGAHSILFGLGVVRGLRLDCWVPERSSVVT